MTASASISRPLRKLLAASPAIYRDGNALITGDPCPAELLPELEALCLPRISDEDRRAVVALLKQHAGRVRYIVDETEAVAVVAELMAAEALAFDVETAALPDYRAPALIAFTKAGTLRKRQPTTGSAGLALDPYRSRVRLVSVFGGTGAGVVVFDLFKLGWDAIAPLWTKPLVAANATFDVRRLMAEANVAPPVVFDVLRVAALTHGLVGQSVSLASLARDLLNLQLPKALAASDWGAEELTRAQLLYSALDAVVTFLVHQAQEHELDRQGRQVRRLMGACVVPVCEMERVGILLDRDRHRAQIAEWSIKLPQLRDALNAVSGGRDLETVAGLQDHLDAVLPAEERESWPTTPTGKLSTAKLILKLNRYLPGITELLALRGVKMLASTFGEGLIERLNPITGRLHPSFRIGSTIAGRFSCAQPNIQQQPARNKAFRSIFRAPEGSSILSCDFSQIELRILAQIVRKDLARLTGQDEETTLDQMFRVGQDIHWQTARRMYELPADAVKEEHELPRANAKAANFSLAYGMGLETFYKRLRGDRPELSIVEADAIRQAWLNTFYDVALWQKLLASDCRRKGYAETRLGRRWHWAWRALDPEALPEDIPFRDDLLIGFSKPLCLNFPVQGSAAEVMLLALVNTHRALAGSAAQMIATVHDELVVECPTSMVVETKARVQAAMTAAFTRLFPEAPVIGLVDAASGPSWGELE
jgi:DNA polymerase I-like protein with 3'-5' exonuclease and polymerase domains